MAAAVGSPDWAPAIAQQIMSVDAGKQVELQLNPAELGPLKVKLSLDDGTAQVALMADHPATRQALEAALPQLRTSLADSGITLGQASVGAGAGEPRPEQGRGEQSPAQDGQVRAQHAQQRGAMTTQRQPPAPSSSRLDILA